MFLRVELLGQYSDSVLASGKLSDWFSQRLRHCTFPSAGQEDSSSSTSLPTLVDNICLFIIAILSSKGLYAQRSNAKTFSGIGFITFACHAFAMPGVSPASLRALTRLSPKFLWDSEDRTVWCGLPALVLFS